ncbi:hypothetical protein BG004_000626 [Podila humilis]|nr:hypothetical protein BG004_000626 [Podila humilis]
MRHSAIHNVGRTRRRRGPIKKTFLTTATVAILLGLTALSTTSAFYIPGLSPNVFHDGDRVPLYVNKIFSEKSPLPYAYADLPFVCPPPENAKKAWLNLGEVLRGDRISSSNYELIVGKDVKCQTLCTKQVAAEDAALARDFIENEYYVEWENTTYTTMSPCAFSIKVNLDQDLPLVESSLLDLKSTHFRMSLPAVKIYFTYCTRLSEDSDVCPDDGSKSMDFQPVTTKDVDIHYTYSVQWMEEKDITWSNRWNLYLINSDVKIHWYSIINSTVIMLFLTGMVALIMMRTLKKDIALYNEEEMKDDQDDTTGWKLVHGDVFRTPKHSSLLCPILGSGVQVLAMTLATVMFALIGVLNPSYRGGFVSSFAGYYSARLYKVFKGTSWTKNAILTATLVPGFLMSIVFLLNLFVWSQNSSNAIPFGTFFALVVMWFGISLPLSFIGAYFGQKKAVIEHPGRTNQIPRQIPEPVWYLQPRFTILAGGLLPFAVIFMELFFILKSIWEDQYYYMFGFLSLVLIILLVTCIEMTIVIIYFQLCDEDYHWWWRSFFAPASSALYIFVYSLVYFTRQLSIDHFVPGLIYFANSLMICVVYALLTGTTGFISTYWFIRKIYSAVKID